MQPINVKSDLDFRDPHWHPNNNSLIVTGWRACPDVCATSIYDLNINDGEVRKLIQENDVAVPTWLPNGQSIGFSWSTSEASGIFTTTVDNHAVPEFFRKGLTASWSHDGKYVAITGERVIDNLNQTLVAYVQIIDLMTNKEAVVFETPVSASAMTTLASWQDDSERLAFVATWWNGSQDQTVEEHLYTVGSDGTNLRTNIAGLQRPRSPGWLPGGNWLFVSYGSDARLGFVNIDQDCLMATDIIGVNSPAISPDGERLAFERDSKIYLIDLAALLGTSHQKLKCSS